MATEGVQVSEVERKTGKMSVISESTTQVSLVENHNLLAQWKEEFHATRERLHKALLQSLVNQKQYCLSTSEIMKASAKIISKAFTNARFQTTHIKKDSVAQFR